jgi:hypothetical protein
MTTDYDLGRELDLFVVRKYVFSFFLGEVKDIV